MQAMSRLPLSSGSNANILPSSTSSGRTGGGGASGAKPIPSAVRRILWARASVRRRSAAVASSQAPRSARFARLPRTPSSSGGGGNEEPTEAAGGASSASTMAASISRLDMP